MSTRRSGARPLVAALRNLGPDGHVDNCLGYYKVGYVLMHGAEATTMLRRDYVTHGDTICP